MTEADYRQLHTNSLTYGVGVIAWLNTEKGVPKIKLISPKEYSEFSKYLKWVVENSVGLGEEQNIIDFTQHNTSEAETTTTRCEGDCDCATPQKCFPNSSYAKDLHIKELEQEVEMLKAAKWNNTTLRTYDGKAGEK